MTLFETLIALGPLIALAHLVGGLFYALFGTSTVSVNGEKFPAWGSFMARLTMPELFMLAHAIWLMRTGIRGLR